MPASPSCKCSSFIFTGTTAVEDEATVLQNYVFGHRLGEGTYGSVYVVTYKPSGERFAMKVLQKDALVGNSEKIVHEAKVMQSLSHPFVVRLIKFLESTVAFYLVMELAEGGELFDLILSSRYFTEKLARHYFQQLLSAIDYCHGAGIAHRDLKAENLLLGELQRLKVCDFGFSWARLMEDVDEDVPPASRVGLVEAGTLHYMPPEMLGNWEGDFDAFQQDLWSAGVILFFMLTGRLPFDGRDEIETIYLIRQAEVTFDEAEEQRLSSEARNLLVSMLRRDPLERPSLRTIIEENAWFNENLDMKLFPSRTSSFAKHPTTFLDFSVPHSVTEAEEATIRAAFDKIDLDGLGSITRDQIRDMLITLCGIQAVDTDNAAGLIALLTGSDGSTSVSYEQFRSAWVDKDLGHNQFARRCLFQIPNILATVHEEVDREVVRQLRAAFDSVDSLHRGSIHAAQWRELFDRCSIEVSDSEIECLVTFIDTFKCGAVTFEEFLVAIVRREMLVRHPMGRKLAAAMNLVGLLRARNVSECVRHGFAVVGLQYSVLDKLLTFPNKLVLLCKDPDASPTENVYTFRYFSDTSHALGSGQYRLHASSGSYNNSPSLSSQVKLSPIVASNPSVLMPRVGSANSHAVSASSNVFQLPKVVRYQDPALCNGPAGAENVDAVSGSSVSGGDSHRRPTVPTVEDPSGSGISLPLRHTSFVTSPAGTTLLFSSNSDGNPLGAVPLGARRGEAEAEGKAEAGDDVVSVVSAGESHGGPKCVRNKADLHLAIRTTVNDRERRSGVGIRRRIACERRVTPSGVAEPRGYLADNKATSGRQPKHHKTPTTVRGAPFGSFAGSSGCPPHSLGRSQSLGGPPNPPTITSRKKALSCAARESTGGSDGGDGPHTSATSPGSKSQGETWEGTSDGGKKAVLHKTRCTLSRHARKREVSATSFSKQCTPGRAKLPSRPSSEQLRERDVEQEGASTRARVPCADSRSGGTRGSKAGHTAHQERNGSSDSSSGSSHGRTRAGTLVKVKAPLQHADPLSVNIDRRRSSRVVTESSARAPHTHLGARTLPRARADASTAARCTEKGRAHVPRVSAPVVVEVLGEKALTDNTSKESAAKSLEKDLSLSLPTSSMSVNWLSVSPGNPLDFSMRPKGLRAEGSAGAGVCDFDLILSPACMGYTIVRFCRIHGITRDFHEAVQFVSTVLDTEREQAKNDTMAKGESEFI